MARTEIAVQKDHFAGLSKVTDDASASHLKALLDRTWVVLEEVVARLNAVSGTGILSATDSARNLSSISAGEQQSWTVTVTGAAVGDKVDVVCSISQALLGLQAYVSAADTVTVLATNNHSGAVDLASADFTVYVTPKATLDARAGLENIEDLGITRLS